MLGKDNGLFICTRCFVRYDRETVHDCFVSNPPMLPIRDQDLNELWETQNPEFTPFDDQPMSHDEYVQLNEWIDQQGWERA